MEITLSTIKKIEMAAQKLPGTISLAQGTPSLRSDNIIREEVIKAIKNNKADKYSPVAGLVELRCLISDNLTKSGMDYDVEEEIIVTAGAIEALSATLLSLINAGEEEEIIILTPTYYTNYREICRMAGATAIEVILDEEKDWSLNINELKSKITKKTKGIIICNPNNPTGSILSKNKLLEIGDLARKKALLLIFDDVYQNLYYKKEKVFCLARESRFKDNLIRIVSLSKDFALSGWRIGFLHGPKRLVSKILPVHDNLINCAPVVSQYAAIAAIKNKDRIISENIKEYTKRKSIMEELLSGMSRFLSFTPPKGTYYFFPKIFGVNNTLDFSINLLKKNRIATVPGSEFGPGGEGHIRLCFGRPEKDIVNGMKRLKQYFTNKTR